MTFRVGLMIAALILGGARTALTLTIFDIIQLTQRGYEDAQIVALIDATNSVFDLEAEDLPRLKGLGVSETVIRSMLTRVAPETTRRGEETLPGSPRRNEVSGARIITGRRPPSLAEAARDRTRRVPAAPRAEPAAPGPRELTLDGPSGLGPLSTLFAALPVAEEDAGGHAHVAVTLNRIPLVMLRDEGRYPSIAARAEAVIEQLRTAWAVEEGEFRAGTVKGGEAVIFQSALDPQEFGILAVTRSDAHAYEIRSGRHVTPALLARYWADLLSDYRDMVVRRSPPSRLLGLHEGESLGVLHVALGSVVGNGGQELDAALKLLPGSVQHHLERLAAAIPTEYHDERR